jgi:LPXTG-motif cell wall-anchored protein
VSFAFYAFAFFVVANPFRWRLSLPETGDRTHFAPLAAGLAILVVIAVIVAAAADSVLDWLDISPETWRIASGVVVIAAGLWVMVFPHRPSEASLPALWAGVAPVFFPVLLAPELYVLLKATGADEGVGVTLGALILPVATVAALGTVRRTSTSAAVLTGLSRLLAALAVVAGLALIISGIRDV